VFVGDGVVDAKHIFGSGSPLSLLCCSTKDIPVLKDARRLLSSLECRA
jgi:hypothetical protein